MVPVLGLLAVVFLSYANGANDNSKGVATLIGSGTLTERQGILLALATTLAGAALSALWAEALVKTFSGKGLVPDSVVGDPRFLLAVATAAAVAGLLATRLGLPVSTTHALLGGLLGAGLVFANGRVSVAVLGTSLVLPLFFSPLVAAFLASLLLPAVGKLGTRPASEVCLHNGAPGTQDCLCIGVPATPAMVVANEGGSASALPVAPLGLTARPGTAPACAEGFFARPLMLSLPKGISGAAIQRALHLLSAGALSFARGLNDAPKIAAIAVVVATLELKTAAVLVAGAMALGGWLGAGRVARTMSREITSMDVREGLSGNLTASVLVLAASRYGLPVSTTHVTCGVLFGIGARKKELKLTVLRRILAAWVTTLPLAALLGALVALLIRG
ncbi:MAG: inorganic phosphate transporter [Acidobacteria bacterium]|nr:inorganic phosphate transporter [Acidobacteriota bacterium]